MNLREWKQMPELPAIRTEELTPEDLKEWRRKAYRGFYFRPAYIFERLGSIRSMAQIKFYLKGLMAVKSLTK